jgi:hypothetical protein
MEPKNALPHSQQLSTCPYSELDQSIPPNLIAPRSIWVFFSFPPDFLPTNYTRSSSPHSCFMPCPSPQLDHSIYTWRRLEITKLRAMQILPPLHPSATSSLFSPNNLLNTLFCVPSLMSETKFHNHTETTGKIIVLYNIF